MSIKIPLARPTTTQKKYLRVLGDFFKQATNEHLPSILETNHLVRIKFDSPNKMHQLFALIFRHDH